MSGTNKWLYPILMFFGKFKSKKASILFNKENKKPAFSFYDLQTVSNNDAVFLFEKLKGKKALIVNTASNCGYTDQYDELQKLYELHGDKLMIIGFPSNDFNEQEKGNDDAIAAFCKINFGVTFPLMKKSIVIKNDDQNEVYKWLTDAKKNGWNDRQPGWNFSKYLVNEEGILTHYFETIISPLSDDIQKLVGK